MLSNRRVRHVDRLPLPRRIQKRASDGRSFLAAAPRANRYQSIMDGSPCKSQSDPMDSGLGERTTERLLVSVVDDDESIRESLPDLLWEFGFAGRAFSSGKDFLSSDYVDGTKCLILDIMMPGMTGLDVQEELRRRGRKIPIIFISAKRDDAVRARAIEQGAVKFLHKPFSDTTLLEALNAAIQAK